VKLAVVVVVFVLMTAALAPLAIVPEVALPTNPRFVRTALLPEVE
jgi:hypothetical protein